MIPRFLILLVVLCSGLIAQVPSKTVGPVVLSVYAEGSAASFKGLSYLVAGKPQAVPVTLGKRGAKFRYSGAQELVFFVEVPGVNGAAPTRAERARVTLPEGSSECLLMLGEKSGRMGMSAIDVSLAIFPVGAITVLNYTPVPIAVKIGKQNGVAQPQRPARFGPFPSSNANIDYLMAAQIDGQWKVLIQNSYTPRENMRFVLLLRQGSDPTKPDLIWINDYVTPKTPAAGK